MVETLFGGDGSTMRRVHGLVLIGGAQRDAGKTSFASALIRRVGAGRPVVGAKVTVIRNEGRGGCARGGEGCGVCVSLAGRPFLLEEERGALPRKDTARLLAAGADSVWWLRVAEASLAEGRDALLAHVDPGAVVVCESNSFRMAVEPDLFLLVDDPRQADSKASCRAVLPLVDALVHSFDRSFDPRPDSIWLHDGRWSYRRPATAVILAGGRSRRMGTDKALLKIDGEPLIRRLARQLERHVEQVLISARRVSDYSYLGYEVVPDRVPDLGPLGGIASALARSAHDLTLFVPCDLPGIPQDLVTRLLREARSADAVVPRREDGQVEPLFAVYRRRVLPSVNAALSRGARRVIAFHDACDLRTVDLAPGVALDNLNTRAAYEAHTGTV